MTAIPAQNWNDPRLLSEWYVIGWSHEIVRGAILARRALDRDLVLWRSSNSKLHCWLDLCIHRGAKLSLGIIQNCETGGAGDCLICPYHGWKYAESGLCIGIPSQPDLEPPAKARAQIFQVEERYGAIWVCLGESAAGLPEFQIGESVGFRTLHAGPYKFRALGPRLVENFLDVAHLGIVHDGVLGNATRSVIEDYEVVMGRFGPEAEEIRLWQPNPDGTGAGAFIRYRYQVHAPLTASLIKLADQSEKRFGILAQVMPVGDEWSEMRMIMALNYAQEIPDCDLIAFQDRVVEQDRVIVESQRPELVPLDLQSELHLRSDRMAIAYRRWLREIGYLYGVA
jgi:phenylpropionate dioxygenase-like ring-hydroxylating dioxygenase large terminal subunit